MTDTSLPGAAVTAAAPAFRDVTVYTAGQWKAHHDVHVVDGIVTAIAPTDRPGEDTGGYVIPGFVNTHTHLQQSLMRGIAECTPLLEWLLAVGEESVAITPERAYLAAVSACLELLRSGTTTVVEHMWPNPSHEIHDAVVRALRDTGIRAVLGRGVADRADPSRKWGFEPRLMQPLGEVLDHVDHLRNEVAGSAISMALAVPNPRSVTDAGMRTIRDFAQERGLPVSIHLLETGTDEQMCRQHTGFGAVDHLDRNGFLWDRVLAVHCVELDDAGQRTLAARKVAVSHNPLSNMRLGSGVAPIPAMLERGLAVGLGVDGAASNDTQDMLATLRIAAYLQRAVHRRADLLGFPEMLDIACGGANSALGLSPVTGGVTVGSPADLTLVRFDRDYATLPVRDPGASLLTTGSRSIVDTVMVGGEIVVEDGRHTRIDEAEFTKQLAALSV
ncbi:MULTISPECIES: amidohydrolase family protein [unclassified Gordonia (in: high G+C Gram-positive bacteria)]|uniref:amidohydrolase family protein n=1 Tax=unclassified Gordonia (in: high G+C Gram-positive bacteria) TaxID=2657482 RepID=UPI001CF9B1BD|nr:MULTISPECIES: amidohydrolase family protein [unclassified Gordonia (in: high G+C Gram-positive bacteria)]MCT1352308.1 amidohydrolase family protein [Gordonia sp. p3-SID1431]UCZ89788.1 amidohydrolase family protein [Gordonia sp. WA4-43]